MRILITTVAGVVAVASLAGCSGDATTETSKSAAAATSAAAAKTTQPDGSFGARAELTKTSCSADKDGVWSFKGTLTNAQKAEQNYVVTASIVNGKTFTVLGTKQIKQKLAPGKSVEVKADDFYKKKDGAQCVLRVTRKAA